MCAARSLPSIQGRAEPESGKTEGLLRLCFRLLRSGPGDDILHLSLLVVGKVTCASLRGRVQADFIAITANSFRESPGIGISPQLKDQLHKFSVIRILTFLLGYVEDACIRVGRKMNILEIKLFRHVPRACEAGGRCLLQMCGGWSVPGCVAWMNRRLCRRPGFAHRSLRCRGCFQFGS